MLRTFQFLWLLPATILVCVFYIVPLILLRSIRYEKQIAPCVFLFSLYRPDAWYSRKWRDWAGWSGPCVIILKSYTQESSPILDRTKIHELEHASQQFRWGILFYPAYLMCSIWIYIFQQDRHAYYDNPFERDARLVAGQVVEIPKEQWNNDRWPWW